MSGCIFTLQNIKKSPLEGYQQKIVVVSANGYTQGYSGAFDALIDPGAFHTCISKALMDEILETVVDKRGNRLKEAGKAHARGVYGNSNQEPIYILPHFYIGNIHLTDVAVTVLKTDNIQCLIGRSILHQCILTLDPELNNMQLNFKESLKCHKRLIDNIPPFNEVLQFSEFPD